MTQVSTRLLLAAIATITLAPSALLGGGASHSAGHDEVLRLQSLVADLIAKGAEGPDGRPLFPDETKVLHAGVDENGALVLHLEGDLDPVGPLAETIEELRLEAMAGAVSAADIESGVWIWIRRPDGAWRMLGDLSTRFDEPRPTRLPGAGPRDVSPEPFRGTPRERLHPTEQAPGLTYTFRPALGGALEGVRIALSAGHGWVPDGSGGWRTQRALWKFDGCGDCRGIIEDHFNAEIKIDYVIPLLLRMGAEILVVREPDSTLEHPIIMDAGDPGYTETGDWEDGTSGGYFGRGYRVLGPGESGAATFSPPHIQGGPRNVQVRWLEGANRIHEATVTVDHAGGTHEVGIDQRRPGRGWMDLGRFWFEPGAASVTLSRGHEEGWLIADAVKLGGGIASISGKPWWQMAAVHYVAEAGAPSSISSLGDVTIRPTYAEHVGADLYISIHANASGQPGGSSANGIETYRYSCQMYPNFSSSDAAGGCDDPPGSKALIDAVHPAILSRLRADWDSTFGDRGKKVANFGEVRELDEMPGILIEAAFFDNIVPVSGRRMSDNQALHDPRFREAFTYGLADGLAAHVLGSSASAPPARPTGLHATNEAGGLMRLGWSEVPGAQGYVVYVASGNRGFAPRPVVAGTEMILDDLVPGRKYSFRVASADSNGESLPSMAVSARFTGASDEPDPAKILLVMGYERLDAWTQHIDNDLAYAVEHGVGLAGAGDGVFFDGATHAAFSSGALDLSGYQVVIYAAGKGESAERAWASSARSKLESFLDSGGALLVSGEDVAWQLAQASGDPGDQSFLQGRLGAALSDRSGGDHALLPVSGGPFEDLDPALIDDGRDGIYWVRRPDALLASGASSAVLSYSNDAVAAVATSRTILLGVPVETIVCPESRAALLRMALLHLAPDLPLDLPPDDDPPDDDPPGGDDPPEDDDPPGGDDPPNGEDPPGDYDPPASQDPSQISGGCGCAQGPSVSAQSALGLFGLLAFLAILGPGRPRRRASSSDPAAKR